MVAETIGPPCIGQLLRAVKSCVLGCCASVQIQHRWHELKVACWFSSDVLRPDVLLSLSVCDQHQHDVSSVGALVLGFLWKVCRSESVAFSWQTDGAECARWLPAQQPGIRFRHSRVFEMEWHGQAV